MRILIISSYFPCDNIGGGVRLGNIIKGLAKRGYRISLLSFIDAEKQRLIPFFMSYCETIDTVPYETRLSYPFRSLGTRLWNLFSLNYPDDVLHFRSDEFQAKLNSLLNKVSFDIVQIEFPEMAAYVDRVPNEIVKVYDSHEVRSRGLARLVRREKNLGKKIRLISQLRKMRAYERDLCNKYDAIIALTRKDQEYFLKESPQSRVYLVPTGVDLNFWQINNNSVKRWENSLIFVGNYAHYPNPDGVIWFTNRIFPIIEKRVQDVRFFIVGAQPSQEIVNLSEGNKNIIVTGYVEDLRKYLQKGSVFVAPFRLGAGIKGKIVEAMATGIPVVSTSIGCEGIDVNPGENILIADKPEDFANMVVQLLHNEGFRQRLAEKARGLVEYKYNWDKNLNELERAYNGICRM